MKSSRRILKPALAILCAASAAGILWFISGYSKSGPPDGPHQKGGPLGRVAHEPRANKQERPARKDAGRLQVAGRETAESESRPAFQFDRKEVKIDPWVEELRPLRGASLTPRERKAAMAFLAGTQVPEGMGKGSIHWLADELLTVLRLQEAPDEELAAELAKSAFRPATDPMVRDYIMQHLGHLWEQYGLRPEIDAVLWRAVGTSDETTPGSALIALSRCYERDLRPEELAKVRQRALELAANPHTSLAVRVTVLAK